MSLVVFTAFDPGPLATGGSWPNSDAARTAFFSNLTSISTYTFDSETVGTSVVFPNFGISTAAMTGGVVQALASSGRFAISAPNYWNTATSSFNMNFTTPVQAFGFYATDIGDFGGILSIDLVDSLGNTTSHVIPSPPMPVANASVLFWGFYDTVTSYSTVTFDNSSTVDTFGFDNLSVGIPNPGGATKPPWLFYVLGTG